MKIKIALILSLLLTIPSIAQVKTIIIAKEMQGYYYDDYSPFSTINLFHNQNLINFKKNEEFALASCYSLTSKEIFNKYVLGGEFGEHLYNYLQKADTAQSWIEYLFKFSFKYLNKYQITIIRYRLIINGKGNTKPLFDRLIYQDIGSGYLYYIDRQEDDKFLSDLTRVIGSLNKNILRVLLSIDEPKTDSEKELFNLVTSKNESLQLTNLVNMYRNHDKKLLQFFDK
jgi:hypothetical protein